MGKRRRNSVKAKARSSQRAGRPSRSEPSTESSSPTAARLEDRVTVFWMLSTVFALAAIAMGLAATVAAEYVVSAEAQPRARAALDYARLTTAIVCTILFALTPIVLRLRQVPPPRAITVFVLATATVGLGWSLFGESSSPAPKPGEVETISDGP